MLSKIMKVGGLALTGSILLLPALSLAAGGGGQEAAASTAAAAGDYAWWFWPLILFVITFVMGIFAVLGGVGGGVLYVPIIGSFSFFPFHMDFVRGAGLLVALAGALAAGPGLLRSGMANLRLAIPVALVASTCAIIGAQLGLGMPEYLTKGLLGIVILFIVAVMLTAKKSEVPDVPKSDPLSSTMKIFGVFTDQSSGQEIDWRVHRTPQGLFLFIFIGFIAGMFGLGAGWANVPVLNLVMGAPIKISVATSKFLLSITDTSAAWTYFTNGAIIPMMVVPSVIGIMLGSFVGVRLLKVTKPKVVRWVVIAILLFAGIKSLLAGWSAYQEQDTEADQPKQHSEVIEQQIHPETSSAAAGMLS
ncbi:MAG: sulfite exporter TauE/SafE family protein [Desulfurivibrionaceae bacterium]